MILIGTDAGIYRWFKGSPWPIYHSLQDRAVVALAAPGPGLLAALNGAGRLLESGNNGLDWREIPMPEGAGRPLGLAAGPGGIVLALRPTGLHRRAMGTGAWAPLGTFAIEAPGPATEVRALEFAPGGAGFAAVGGAGLWKTEDGGESWKRCLGLPAEVHAVRVARQAPKVVAAATGEGVYLSTDGGASWAERSGGLEGMRHVRALEIRPDDPEMLLAGCAPAEPGVGPAAPAGGLRFALYESRDGGKTWAHVRRGFPDDFDYDPIVDIRYDPADSDFALVALASGEMWNTRNNGDWWEPINRHLRGARALCPVG